MKLHNTMRQNYGGFTLDADKIELHSTRKNNVELPYTGLLPEDMDATTARIYFNVQPAQQPRVTLIVNHPTGKDTRHPLDATTKEILDILGKLFDNPNTRNPSLSPYWLGIWQANFFAWRETQNIHKLWAIIDNLPTAVRAELLAMIQPTNTTAWTTTCQLPRT